MTLLGQLRDFVDYFFDLFPADGEVAPCKVVGGVLFAGDELVGMKELAILACTDLVDHASLQVNHHCPGHVTVATSVAEEGTERTVAASVDLVSHYAVRRDAVLEAVQLPAGVAHLYPSLADVEGYDFTRHVA